MGATDSRKERRTRGRFGGQGTAVSSRGNGAGYRQDHPITRANSRSDLSRNQPGQDWGTRGARVDGIGTIYPRVEWSRSVLLVAPWDGHFTSGHPSSAWFLVDERSSIAVRGAQRTAEIVRPAGHDPEFGVQGAEMVVHPHRAREDPHPPPQWQVVGVGSMARIDGLELPDYIGLRRPLRKASGGTRVNSTSFHTHQSAENHRDAVPERWESCVPRCH